MIKLLVSLALVFSVILFYSGCAPKEPTLSQKEQLLNKCKEDKTKEWLLKKAKRYNVNLDEEKLNKIIEKEENKIRERKNE